MKKFVVIGVSVAGLGAVSLCFWYYSKVNSKKQVRLEIQIPNTTVGYVIGRSGGTIKDIQTKSQAKIKFVAPDLASDYATCVIKGDSNGVQLAAGIINSIVENFNDTENVKSKPFDGFDFQLSDERILHRISNAMEEIFDSHLKRFETDNTNKPSETQTENVADFIARHTQKLYSPGGDGLIPVYVSAVVDPEKFWVQPIKTKEHADLDRLTAAMCDYFDSNPSSNVPPPVSDIKSGYLCVVFYDEDNRWYRAEICGVSNNNENILNSVVDLCLLDFGESIYEKVINIRAIPSEFLNLNFQAIECSLSSVKAISGKWSQESIRVFEDIVHVGQWYALMARIDFHEDGYRPYIALIDNNSEEPMNIAEKLISDGFAESLD